MSHDKHDRPPVPHSVELSDEDLQRLERVRAQAEAEEPHRSAVRSEEGLPPLGNETLHMDLSDD